MPRKARKSVNGKYFHVMVQGIDREYIFQDDESKGFYLTCLQNNKEFYPVKIIAFCVMGNHAHTLLCVKNTKELSGYFKRVNADYARYYNRTHGRIGYVFRDRFKSEQILDEKYLAYCMAYIQNNPLKAGIVEKAEEYKYSSLPNYLTGKGIIDFKEAAKYFDITPKNIMAIMTELTGLSWLENNDKEYEDKYEVLEELLKRYNISSKQAIQGMCVILAKEIQERCGISLREIAALLEIGRETLRKRLSTQPSP